MGEPDLAAACAQGVKYNIPVAIWLPEGYPRGPPMMYVVPTPDMIIKPRHSFVDASGVVLSPYVRNWLYPRRAPLVF
jgi:ESCRT-I complex subunit TSG101